MQENEPDIRENELPPDADMIPADTTRAVNRPARKKGIVKKIVLAAAGVLALLYLLLAANEYLVFCDALPTWDDLYYGLGLRTRAYTGHEPGTVSVHFIDVGQGDCALICTENRNILIDSGEYDQYPNVVQYLKGMGVERLDTVIVTHPHSDHMGCMYRVIRRFGAGCAYMPKVPERMIPVTSSYTLFEDTLRECGIALFGAVPGLCADTGGFGELMFLAPVKEYEDLNNFSAAAKYTYGDISFLFTGDIESDAEADILAGGADISADVIKVPHHGSGTSSSRLFVQAVSPEYAVISVGQENDYGHPHANIVSLYENLGVQLFYTDISGDIVFVTDGEELDIYTEKPVAVAVGGRAPAGSTPPDVV